MVHVVFVCLGNICRSPMAEGVFRELVDEAGIGGQISVDSAGTGSWHVGEPAHSGTRRVLRQHGIDYGGWARQITERDMAPNTYVVAMDQSNVQALRRRFGEHPRLYRLLDFASQSSVKDVPDPYHSGNFEYVYQLVHDGCQGLLEFVRREEGL